MRVRDVALLNGSKPLTRYQVCLVVRLIAMAPRRSDDLEAT